MCWVGWAVVWGLSGVLAAGIAGNAVVLVAGFAVLLYGVVKSRLPPRHALALVVLAGCVYAYGHLATASYHRHIAHFTELTTHWTGPVWVEGWVASYPLPGYGSTQFELATTINGSVHRVSVRTTHFTIGFGDSLRLLVDRPRSSRRDDSRYFLGSGLCGSVRVVPGSVHKLAGRGGSALRREVLWRVHDRLRRDIASGVGSRAAVPLALFLGERGTLDRADREAFAKLGILHLLALSGQHLGFLAGALLLLMRAVRCRRRGWILIVLCLYVGLAGFILSLYRSLVMVMILAVASGVHRPMRPITALANAFFLMLLWYPFALFSIGFQLSFLATLGVLMAVARIGPAPTGRRRMGYWVTSTILVSVAAEVALVPPLLAYFGQISWVAPIATALFVAPTVVLLFLAPAAAAIAAVLPAAGPVAFGAVHYGSLAFDEMLAFSARFAPAPLEMPAPNAYVYYVALGVIVCSRRAWLKVVGLVVLAGAWLL